MKTLKLLALSLVACFAMSAQAAEVIQLQVNNSYSDCEGQHDPSKPEQDCENGEQGNGGHDQDGEGQHGDNQDEHVSQPTTQYHSYYFGINWVHSRRVVRFDVVNTGTTPLSKGVATISGPGYSAIHSCTGVILPKQSCWFEISYWPYFEGVHYGRFILSFKENSHIVVNVWGEARRF